MGTTGIGLLSQYVPVLMSEKKIASPHAGQGYERQVQGSSTGVSHRQIAGLLLPGEPR